MVGGTGITAVADIAGIITTVGVVATMAVVIATTAGTASSMTVATATIAGAAIDAVTIAGAATGKSCRYALTSALATAIGLSLLHCGGQAISLCGHYFYRDRFAECRLRSNLAQRPSRR